jgi:uncharacterized protein (TIGR02270 family)
MASISHSPGGLHGERPAIPVIIHQHVAEAGILHDIRSRLVHAPHVKLEHLARFDQRVAAHLDALAIAGPVATTACLAALETTSSGGLFAATVRIVEGSDEEVLGRLCAFAEAAVEIRSGLMSAFGWVSPAHLQGLVIRLLRSENEFKRLIGITACALHRVDAGIAAHVSQRSRPESRARALRAVGELGLSGSLPGTMDDDPRCRFWQIWSSVLLGARNSALEDLFGEWTKQSNDSDRALSLFLQASSVTDHVRQVLRKSMAEGMSRRTAIRSVSIVGDPSQLPWLIAHMSDERLARTAGEAFSLVTGADIGLLDLDRKPPEDFHSGPTDNPDDDNVDMDPDEGLPWPDVRKIEDWWMRNRDRFTPGQRYFMGAPVTKEHCIHVLKHGYQRQRILAAQYLCLLEPGTPLFNTSAPAWRQQRLLAQM